MAAGEGTRLQLWPLSLLYQAEAGGGGGGWHSAADPLDLGFRKKGGGKVECPSNLTSRPLADTRHLPPRRFASQWPYIYRAAALLDRHVLYIYMSESFPRPTGKE